MKNQSSKFQIPSSKETVNPALRFCEASIVHFGIGTFLEIWNLDFGKFNTA